MITVAPVHCKYGKISRFPDFYRLRCHMLLWDVSLTLPLLPFSSNCTESCYCANSYTIDTFARAYYGSEEGLNMPFPSSPAPLYQNEVKCSTFDMKMIFYSHANKTHFHKKGCALGLILKVGDFGTRKWPISSKCILKKFYSSQQHSLLHCLRF